MFQAQAFRPLAAFSEDVAVAAGASATTVLEAPLGVFVARVVSVGGSVRVAVGIAPATATSTRLIDGVPEYVLISPGERVTLYGTEAASVNVSYMTR